MKVFKIKKRAGYVSAAQKGTKWVTSSVVVQVRAHGSFSEDEKDKSNLTENLIRVGFTATKRVGNAVHRNRIKRRLRALSVEIMPRVKEGHDIVFIGRHTAFDKEFKYLRKDILYCLRKLKVLNPEC